MSQQKIKIILVNGETQFTGRNRARRFIRDGRAIWTDETQSAIRFVEIHHAHVSAQAQSFQPTWPRHSDYGYERAANRECTGLTELATMARNMPMCGDAIRLIVRMTKTGNGLRA